LDHPSGESRAAAPPLCDGAVAVKQEQHADDAYDEYDEEEERDYLEEIDCDKEEEEERALVMRSSSSSILPKAASGLSIQVTNSETVSP
jgi:hypothetical protein